MSQKSLASLLKDQVLDDGLPVQVRKKSLRNLRNPSRRFLEGLIRSPRVPPELRRTASRLLVAKLSPPKPFISGPSLLPTPNPQPRDEKASAHAEVDAMSDELKELLGIIDKHLESPSSEVDESGEHRRYFSGE
jgi:hypothetical protein